MTLLFEGSDDPAYNAAQVERFVREHGIPWHVVAVPGDLDQAVAMFPDELELELASIPVVLFLDVAHRLVGYHTGFPWESDRARYQEATRTFRAHAAAALRP